MCSTVGKGNLCKNKHQCPWGRHLTLDVHGMQLILIDAIHLHGRNHGLDYCHAPLAHVAVYVEWKINQRSGETVKLYKRHHALASCDRAPETR